MKSADIGETTGILAKENMSLGGIRGLRLRRLGDDDVRTVAVPPMPEPLTLDQALSGRRVTAGDLGQGRLWLCDRPTSSGVATRESWRKMEWQTSSHDERVIGVPCTRMRRNKERFDWCCVAAGQASHAMLVWPWLCWARCCWVRGLGSKGLGGLVALCLGVGDDVVVGLA
jgi:hypothetical protein